MDPGEQIDLFKSFFDLYPGLIKIDSNVIQVSFKDLAEFNPDLAQELLENPEDTIRAGQIALENQEKDIGVNITSSMSYDTHDIKDIHDIDFTFPSFCISNKLKVLYLLSVVESASFQDILSIIKMEQSALSKLFSRPKEQNGLHDMGLCHVDVMPSNVMLKMYKISDSGKKYIQKCAQDSFERINNEKKKSKYQLRFFDVSKTHLRTIGNIRSMDLHKFLVVDCIIRQKTDIRPNVTSARFECPSCGSIMTVLQLDTKMREPTNCGCGRKGRFRVLSKEMIDVYMMVIEDSDSSNPVRIPVFVSNDLVNTPLIIGQRVQVIGVLEEIPILAKDGGKLTRFDWMIKANNLIALEEFNINITPDDVILINKYADTHGSKVIDELASLFASNISGNIPIKKGLILQAVSGNDIKFPGLSRQPVHIYIVGDPGSGKTQLALRGRDAYQKSVYVDLTKSSSVGLTASVIKDEILKGYTLEAGALVLAGSGLAVLDELDKIKPEYSQAIGEPMEKGTITVSKANIHQTIQAKCRVLGLGNYVLNGDQTILDYKSLGIMPQIIDRFDLIFKTDKVPARILAKHILKLHTELQTSQSFLRKYLFYAYNHTINYELDEICSDKLIKYFEDVQNGSKGTDHKFSARLLEALRRIAYASAKLRLSSKVELCDIDIAISLMSRSLSDKGFILNVDENLSNFV